MKIAALQLDIAWNQPELNVERAETLALEAVQQGAELLILPEVFTTGFPGSQGDEARKAGEFGSQFLERFSKEHSVYLCGSLPKFFEPKPHNTLQLFGPKGHIGDYHKRKLITALGEDKRYLAGKDSFQTKLCGLGCHFSICYDIRFPKLYWGSNAELYVVVANWPSIRQAHWDTLLRARAIENQAYVCGVNRVGEGGNLKFIGGSVLYGPRGEEYFKGLEAESVLVGEVDAELVRKWREEFPVERSS